MSNSTLLARCLVAGFLLFSLAQRAQAGLITNGGFEAGGGSLTAWTPASLGDSVWYLQSGTTAPVNVFTVPVPPEGIYAAMADGAGPGTAALVQSFTVPGNALDVTLSFAYYVLNPNSVSGTYTIPSPDSLDWAGDPVQQARVDILTQTANLFDVTPAGSGGGLVANLYRTQPGDSNGTEANPAYSTFFLDITADVTPGGTYQLRFAEANNLGPLVFGIDNVQLVSSTSTSPAVPEPGTLVLLTGGLLALASWRRGAPPRA